MPTPGYWAAVLHKRVMGQTVLSTPQVGVEELSVVCHCARGRAGSIAVLLVNMGVGVKVVLPKHSSRELWVLTSPARLLSKHTHLNGELLVARGDGSLPPLLSKGTSGVDPNLILSAESVAFVVLFGTVQGAASC